VTKDGCPRAGDTREEVCDEGREEAGMHLKNAFMYQSLFKFFTVDPQRLE
jgi:hypothetical protein